MQEIENPFLQGLEGQKRYRTEEILSWEEKCTYVYNLCECIHTSLLERDLRYKASINGNLVKNTIIKTGIPTIRFRKQTENLQNEKSSFEIQYNNDGTQYIVYIEENRISIEYNTFQRSAFEEIIITRTCKVDLRKVKLNNVWDTKNQKKKNEEDQIHNQKSNVTDNNHIIIDSLNIDITKTLEEIYNEFNTQ